MREKMKLKYATNLYSPQWFRQRWRWKHQRFLIGRDGVFSDLYLKINVCFWFLICFYSFSGSLVYFFCNYYFFLQDWAPFHQISFSMNSVLWRAVVYIYILYYANTKYFPSDNDTGYIFTIIIEHNFLKTESIVMRFCWQM